MHFAAGWSFMASALATTVVAGVLSSGQGHWIGGDQTDATGLAFFHWSTTGGDLRVSHFAALHLMQAVPAIAWFWQQRTVASVSLLGGLGVVGLLFIQALMGVPLFQA